MRKTLGFLYYRGYLKENMSAFLFMRTTFMRTTRLKNEQRIRAVREAENLYFFIYNCFLHFYTRLWVILEFPKTYRKQMKLSQK